MCCSYILQHYYIFISSISFFFLVESLAFSICNIMPSANSDNFAFFLSNLDGLSPSLYFIYDTLNFHATLCIQLTFTILPSPMSIDLFLHYCPENKFISTIFLDSHIYASVYSICISLSDLPHSV